MTTTFSCYQIFTKLADFTKTYCESLDTIRQLETENDRCLLRCLSKLFISVSHSISRELQKVCCFYGDASDGLQSIKGNASFWFCLHSSTVSIFVCSCSLASRTCLREFITVKVLSNAVNGKKMLRNIFLTSQKCLSLDLNKFEFPTRENCKNEWDLIEPKFLC